VYSTSIVNCVLVGRCEDEISLGEKLVLSVSITLADFTVRCASDVLAYHGWVDASISTAAAATIIAQVDRLDPGVDRLRRTIYSV